MTSIQIKPDIFWVGVNVRTDDKFEGMWPIPNGVSLNSYIVKGTEKTAIIDLVREWKGSSYDFFRQLELANIDPQSIDFIVLNHLEPDHTEVLRSILRSTPHAQIITTRKGAELVESFYGIQSGIRIVQTGDTVDLGGKTLTFYEIPFVHWPETMVTYVNEDHVLFSCDAFGGFGALDGGVFDDEISPEKQEFYDREILRYYSNIVARYSTKVHQAIDKLKGLEIDVIAPSHGLIWRSNPQRIISKYDTLAHYAQGKRLKPKITLVFGTMYGNTEVMTNAILRGINQVKGVEVEVFEVPNEDNVSHILASAWESAGLAFGMPTYEGKMFPPVFYVVDALIRKAVKYREVFRYGSYGWHGGAQRQFETITKNLQWNCQPYFEYCGGPTPKELEMGEQQGEEFARLIKEKYSMK